MDKPLHFRFLLVLQQQPNRLRLGHHHFTEFIKVHGSGAVFIKFLKDSLKLFLGERSEKFTDESSKSVCGDVAKTLLVIYPESVFEFPLHGLHVGILNQECGAQLTEFSELNFSGTILINFKKKILELLLCGSESHGSHDLTKVISGKELNLLGVKQIKTGLQALDLVGSQASGLVNFIKVNSGVGIVSHGSEFQ